jgi:hypothetical protein
VEANDNTSPSLPPPSLEVNLTVPHWIVGPNDYWYDRIAKAHLEAQEEGFGVILRDAFGCPFWAPKGWALPPYPIHQDGDRGAAMRAALGSE